MQYTERIKLALTYAEESSKRARWIVFVLQLAVIVVIASLWQQADSNWLQQRLYAAQDLVRVLNCRPSAIYGTTLVDQVNKGQINKDQPNKDQINTAQINKDQISKPEVQAAAGHDDSDSLDTKYSCAAVLKDPARVERARKYQEDWGFSLAEARKNVADLQQLMVNRVLGISFPVLGVVFDVNDLSLLAAVTFAILLSWLHFAVQRQRKNVAHVFSIAEKADLSGNEAGNCLSATYYLLAMTQVLTIPPAEEREAGTPTLLKKISRLPSLIMWTAVIAEVMVLIDDGMTMARGSTLNSTVNYVESGLATLLLFYLIARTRACYRIMTDTQMVWNDAFRKARISPEERRRAAAADDKSREMESPVPTNTGEKVRYEIPLSKSSERENR